MKTSIKIFLSSMVLLGAGVVMYDLQLDAAFRKGDYTRPYYDYEKMNFTGFDRIELNSSTAINILVVPGEYKVLANPGIHDFLEIRQEGTRLVINARFLDHFRVAFGEHLLFVSCPVLKEFKADARYSVGKAVITDSVANFPWFRPSVISGFNLDSLVVGQQNAAKVVLQNDTVKRLAGAMGRGADLTLGEGNQFGGGDLDVLNGARLSIGMRGALNLNIHLADSAVFEINGAAAKGLLKINQP
ncbi:MAG TPA: hypothetical protein VG101_01795 [Puia sp.]|nr:hypothetical protein [Puia sp.]